MKLFTRGFVAITLGLVIGYAGKNAVLGQSVFALVLMVASIISVMLLLLECFNGYIKLFTRGVVSFTLGLIIGYAGKNAVLGQSVFALVLMVASIISVMLLLLEWYGKDNN